MVVGFFKGILLSRKFFLIFASIAGIFAPLAAMSSQTSNSGTEGFLTLSVLNNEMKVGQYFASNATVASGDNMNWYIKVHNGMSKAEYIAIKIKLLNSTQQAPDDASNSPSPEREIISLRQLVAANSTWLVPVNWTIAGTDIQDSYTSIKKVAVNNRTIDDLDIRSSDGRSFRVVIELWKYDSDTRNFTFAWSTSSHEQRSVWNQIWFKVKS